MRDYKIAVFLPSLEGGGAERISVDLVRGLAQRGHEVDLVLASARGPFLANVPKDVQVVDLKSSRTLKALFPLGRYLKREKADVLLSALTHANVVALLAKSVFDLPTPVVVAEHSNPIASVRGAKSLRDKTLLPLIRFLYRRADLVVAVSRGVAQQLEEHIALPPSKIRVIYNPIFSNDIFNKAQQSVNHPWFQPNEPPVVLGVGRLAYEKNFELLIRAFFRLRRKQRARLMILGEGPERSRLEKLIWELDLQEDVVLPGFVSNPYPFMRQAKVIALSSRWEALPTVLIEALLLGKEVVSTDCPHGPREILEDGKWGQLVPVEDEESFAAALLRALSSTRSAEEVSAKQASAKERFDFENIVAAYEEILIRKHATRG